VRALRPGVRAPVFVRRSQGCPGQGQSGLL